MPAPSAARTAADRRDPLASPRSRRRSDARRHRSDGRRPRRSPRSDAQEAAQRDARAERRDRRRGGQQHDHQQRELDRLAAPRSARSGPTTGRRPSPSRARAARPRPAPPRKPTSRPSITNGQRMNQLVAPTSRITSTSRRRAKIESRIVLATSSTEASTSSAGERSEQDLDRAGRRQDLLACRPRGP